MSPTCWLETVSRSKAFGALREEVIKNADKVDTKAAIGGGSLGCTTVPLVFRAANLRIFQYLEFH